MKKIFLSAKEKHLSYIIVGLRCLGTYQCLGPIKNQGTHQGDTKLNPAKILGQTLIREILSYSFNGSHKMLTAMSSL
jgi:hypothetical protein